jgi:hypothetical protein
MAQVRARWGPALAPTRAIMKAKRHLDGRPARLDDGNAFLPDLGGNGSTSAAADAEFFGEEFIGSATTGESQSEAVRDEVVDEEDGGPFIVLGEDGSLPPDDSDEQVQIEAEGHEPIARAQSLRGANWAARGA